MSIKGIGYCKAYLVVIVTRTCLLTPVSPRVLSALSSKQVIQSLSRGGRLKELLPALNLCQVCIEVSCCGLSIASSCQLI